MEFNTYNENMLAKNHSTQTCTYIPYTLICRGVSSTGPHTLDACPLLMHVQCMLQCQIKAPDMQR